MRWPATLSGLLLSLMLGLGCAPADARPAAQHTPLPSAASDPDEDPDVVTPKFAKTPRLGLGDHDDASSDDEMLDASLDDPGERYQTDGSDQDDPAEDDRKLLEAEKRPYEISTSSGAELKMAPPTLPDLTPYTADKVMEKIQQKRPGRAEVASVLNQLSFRGFMGRDERMRDWAARQGGLPKAIFIRGGYVTPRDIARQVPRQYFEEVQKGVFVARLPIDVAPGATLHIDDSVGDFRLSQDRGSFLINEGRLFITGSRLRAWNEARKDAAQFEDKHDFRPFIVSWGGSQTYIVNSVIANLGYASSKSYGVSISQFSPSLKQVMNRPNPSGWIIDSEFYDLWYGFYCYEAEDFVLRGNDYHDNIKYGIDPHDRSRRLIIAENKAYRTREKHGIIVSREVDDSWIINNEAYENHLSGIVVDRNSVNNVVAYNRVYRNKSDGITIYESPQTLIWGNLVTRNNRHGMRVRNSTDVRLYDNVAIANGLSGVYGHVKDLRGTGRNMALDPFRKTISMIVAGGQLISNGSSPVNIDQPLSLELYDVDLRAPQRELGIKFTGILGKHQDEVLNILMRQKKAVVVRPATATVVGTSN
ncbi:mannuronan 5-epimerase AlgG [Hydrocarboniphaga sp.]|uniref:mannuronan 5-epimerase AlgG n=1 Tax=Hydrocarboniphaga sp. TaxID=2033016 RepID=UPI00262C5046|nr:mannuronan 5-epimerase AlgG [Hydrocarboniphaga sp.]